MVVHVCIPEDVHDVQGIEQKETTSKQGRVVALTQTGQIYVVFIGGIYIFIVFIISTRVWRGGGELTS